MDIQDRDVLPLERYQREQSGETIEAPDSCDVCQKALQPGSQRAVYVWWRTPENVVEEKELTSKLGAKITGVKVVEKTVTWYERVGAYFLCPDCRHTFRPRLKQAVLLALALALVVLPLALALGQGIPLYGVMLVPGAAFAGGIWWGLRCRFKGYPASSGFRLHRTSFDNRDQDTGKLVAILGFCLLLFVGVLAPSEKPVQFRLVQTEGGGIGPDRVRMVGDALTGLAKATKLEPDQVGEFVLVAWQKHSQLSDGLYANVRVLMNEAASTYTSGRFETTPEALIADMGADTSAHRLARLQADKVGAPYASEEEFEKLMSQTVVDRDTQLTLVQKVEEVYSGLKATGDSPDVLLMVTSLSTDLAGTKQEFAPTVKAWVSRVYAHPDEVRR